jgi:hypothetical protein
MVLQESEPFGGDVGQKLLQFVLVHDVGISGPAEAGHYDQAFCFSLQAMHTRVHGIAVSRASAIGSPQSRQTP